MQSAHEAQMNFVFILVFIQDVSIHMHIYMHATYVYVTYIEVHTHIFKNLMMELDELCNGAANPRF